MYKKGVYSKMVITGSLTKQEWVSLECECLSKGITQYNIDILDNDKQKSKVHVLGLGLGLFSQLLNSLHPHLRNLTRKQGKLMIIKTQL